METAQELHWYGLLTMPTYEFMVRNILRRRGLIAHTKIEKRLRRTTAKDKARKDKPYAIPGYCFIGLKADDPTPWAIRHAYHMVRGVVSVCGRPAQMDQERLKEFLGYDDFRAPDHFKYYKTGAQEFKIGEVLRISNRAFEELSLPLVEVREGDAIFHITMFGKQTELRASLEDCYPAPTERAA